MGKLFHKSEVYLLSFLGIWVHSEIAHGFRDKILQAFPYAKRGPPSH